jgi:hypothetical protein
MRTPNELHPLSGALGQIDTILADLAERDRSSAVAVASMVDSQQAFLSDFAKACREEVRPAMEAVLERLSAGGGGGSIDEHPGGGTRFSTPRLTLWMSLQGHIVGTARPDRHPYLQLDADLLKQEVRVTEGDMWSGSGSGHSGPTGAWQISEITQERVAEELVAILRRSVPHDAGQPIPERREREDSQIASSPRSSDLGPGAP